MINKNLLLNSFCLILMVSSKINLISSYPSTPAYPNNPVNQYGASGGSYGQACNPRCPPTQVCQYGKCVCPQDQQ
jgi:hypothetical protein